MCQHWAIKERFRSLPVCLYIYLRCLHVFFEIQYTYILQNILKYILLLVQFSRSVVSDSSWPQELQHDRPPCPSPTPRVHPKQCPPSQWCHPTVSSSVVPFSACPNLSKHQGLFQWVSSLHQVAKVLEFQLQHQSFQWTPRTDLL